MKPTDGEQVRAAIRLCGGQDSSVEEQWLKCSFEDESQSDAFLQPDATVSPILRKLARLDEITSGLGHRVGTLFLEESRARLAELALALTRGDAAAVAAIAHAVRGSAANVGADAMVLASASLENLGRGQNLNGAGASFDDLSEAFEQARELLSLAGRKDAA